MNKKGNIMAMIIFVAVLFVILFVGFIMVTGSAVLNFVFDTAVPELSGVGQVGDANFTEMSGYTIEPVNDVIQSFTWLTGVLYILMLVGSVGMAFAFRTAPNKWLIAFYFMLVIILIIGSIFVSNMYEEFYDGTDDLALRLKEHTLLSWMILYSPTIFTVISFLTGIVLFSGMGQEEFV